MTPSTKVAQQLEQASESGTDTVQNIQSPTGDGHDQTIILEVTHPKNGQRTMIIPYLPEKTNLADLIEAFCGDTKKPTSKRLPVVVSIPQMIHARVNECDPPPEVLN